MDWLAALSREFAPDAAAPYAELRQAALRRVGARGLPTPREEAWKYTDLKPYDAAADAARSQAQPSPLALLETGGPQLVFVDGVLDAARSSLSALPAGVRVRTLTQVLREEPDAIAQAMTRYTAEDAQIFAALNAACARDGAVVELAAGATLAQPLVVAFLNTAAATRLFTLPLVVVKAGAQSVVSLLELHYGAAGATNHSNALCDIEADTGSRVEHYRLQAEASGAVHIGNLRLGIGRDARVASHSLAFGGRLARLDINAELSAPGGEVVLNGLFQAGAGQHIDHQTRIDHAAPHTTSHELYKGLAGGDGRGVFRGQVLVRKHAQKIAARQASHNLLLSPLAEIDTKPELEIYADDVTCAHGATVGQLDDTALFYLRSRGIAEAEARALLVFAFTQEVVEQVAFEPLRNWLAETLAGSADVPLPERVEVAS